MANNTVVVSVETAVSKGLLTYAGLSGAIGQYAASVAVFLASDDKVLALGPLGTATATLLAVIAARTSQAKAAIQSVAPQSPVTKSVIGSPDNSQSAGHDKESAQLAGFDVGSDDSDDPDGLPEYPTNVGPFPADQGDAGKVE